jgi:hypothetical protein
VFAYLVEEVEPDCPVVVLLLFGVPLTCELVIIIMEFGPITMLTRSPSLSFALTMNEPGTTCTSLNPCCCSFCLIFCGSAWAVWFDGCVAVVPVALFGDVAAAEGEVVLVPVLV